MMVTGATRRSRRPKPPTASSPAGARYTRELDRPAPRTDAADKILDRPGTHLRPMGFDHAAAFQNPTLTPTSRRQAPSETSRKMP